MSQPSSLITIEIIGSLGLGLLRHERLTVFFGYFALLGVVVVAFIWSTTALSDVDEEAPCRGERSWTDSKR